MGTRYKHMDVYQDHVLLCKVEERVKLLLHWKHNTVTIALKAWHSLLFTMVDINKGFFFFLLLYGSEPERLFSHHFPFL